MQDYYVIKIRNQCSHRLCMLLTICSWQKPILKTHRCSLWSSAISAKFYRNIWIFLSVKSLTKDRRYHFKQQGTSDTLVYFTRFNYTDDSYLIHQRLKITKVSPTWPDDTAKFLSWEYRRSREPHQSYTRASSNNHRNVLRNALNCTTR